MAKVLIAEDNLMIADMAEEFLAAEGYDVVGIGRTVAEAVGLARQHKPDLIVIDLRLADGGLGTDIVAQLGAVPGLGILYASGNAPSLTLTSADGQACLTKPYRGEDLVRGLQIVAGMVADGTVSLPLPRGFSVLGPAARRSEESLRG